MPDTEPAVFGCLQNYLFTGKVYAGLDAPDYSILLGVWKLATDLRISDVRIAVLDAMSERRLQTNCIPGRPLLLQAWKQTEENSGLRLMLTSWAAEHSKLLFLSHPFFKKKNSAVEPFVTGYYEIITIFSK